LILYSLLEIFVYFFEIKTGISRNYHLPNNIESFIHNLILTNGFLLNVETFNSPSWSISVEFYCYIFFSLIVLFFKKYYKIFALLIIFVSFLFLYNYSRIESLRFERITSGYIALFRCLYSFFIGSIFFFIFKKYNLTIYKFYSIFFSILIVLIFFQKYQLNILSPLIFVLIIFFAQYSNSNNFFQKLLVNKTLVFVGTISYSIYISHYIILWILRQFYRFVYKAEYINPKLNYSFILDGFESYFFIFLGIGVTILASVLLNSFIESKFMYFSNKNFKKL
jgi:peptidoglycan/LPS O-acetylase OafA/YrhL